MNLANLAHHVAQAGYDSGFQGGSSANGCYVNGQPASCAQAGGIAAIVLIPMILAMIVLFVFWVKSLMHVIKHEDVPNRTLWLVLHFVGLGLLTGVIYLLAVKKPYERSHAGAAAGAAAAGGQPAYSQVAAQPMAPQSPAPAIQNQQYPQPPVQNGPNQQ